MSSSSELRRQIFEAFPNPKTRSIMLRIANVAQEGVETLVNLHEITNFADLQGVYVEEVNMEFHYDADEVAAAGETRFARTSGTGTGSVEAAGVAGFFDATLDIKIVADSTPGPVTFKWRVGGGDYSDDAITVNATTHIAEIEDLGLTLTFGGSLAFDTDDVFQLDLSVDTLGYAIPYGRELGENGCWLPEEGGVAPVATTTHASSGCIGVDGAAGYYGYAPGDSGFLFPMLEAQAEEKVLASASVSLTLTGLEYEGTLDGSVYASVVAIGAGNVVTQLTDVIPLTGSTPFFIFTPVEGETLGTDQLLMLFVSAGAGKTFYGQAFASLGSNPA